MSNIPKVKVKFYISSTKLDFDRVTEILNLKPNKILLKETSIMEEFSYDCWVFESGYKKTKCKRYKYGF